MATLIVVLPESFNRKAFSLTGPPVVLGRGEGCAIRINSYSVSRRHARVFHNGDVWVVEDLQSTNGSWVNDLPVEQMVLHDSDFLKVGNVVLKFLAGGPDIPTRDEDDGDPGSGAPAALTLRLPKPSN